MSKALVTGAAQTSHDEMLHKTRDALAALLADLQTQQSSVDALHEIARKQEEDLATHQSRRTELLAQLQIAQLASNKAQAARDLALGTKSAHKREAAYEQAVAHVNALHAEMLDLATADAKVKEEMGGTQVILEDAEHNLQRIMEREQIARSLVEEEEEAHREEIKQAYLEKLTLARQEHAHLRQQVLLAEDKIQQVQDGMVEALRPWPEYARGVLSEVLEIPDDEGTEIVKRHLDYSLYLEEHAGSFDTRFAQLLDKARYSAVFFKNYGSRSVQRGGLSQNELIRKGKGRGINPDLWGYDDSMTELEHLLEQSRAEHRRHTIEHLLGNQEETNQQPVGWTEVNMTL